MHDSSEKTAISVNREDDGMAGCD